MVYTNSPKFDWSCTVDARGYMEFKKNYLQSIELEKVNGTCIVAVQSIILGSYIQYRYVLISVCITPLLLMQPSYRTRQQ